MRVLRVVAEGPTTSFRYPHFMQGVHPTFEMPPPATIYGHICSTLGEWIAPEGIGFGYHFTYQAKFDDIEHILVLTRSRGRLKGTSFLKATEGRVNPYKRTILFRPRLVLYLNRPEWESAFRSPRYPVALGRSQDLLTYTDIKVITLIDSDKAYFENTLAPYTMNLQTGSGYAVLMPRFLDYSCGRIPAFDKYLVLKRRVHSEDMLKSCTDPVQGKYLVDPTSEQDRGAHLGVLFHTFIGDNNAGALPANMA